MYVTIQNLSLFIIWSKCASLLSRLNKSSLNKSVNLQWIVNYSFVFLIEMLRTSVDKLLIKYRAIIHCFMWILVNFVFPHVGTLNIVYLLDLILPLSILLSPSGRKSCTYLVIISFRCLFVLFTIKSVLWLNCEHWGRLKLIDVC